MTACWLARTARAPREFLSGAAEAPPTSARRGRVRGYPQQTCRGRCPRASPRAGKNARATPTAVHGAAAFPADPRAGGGRWPHGRFFTHAGCPSSSLPALCQRRTARARARPLSISVATAAPPPARHPTPYAPPRSASPRRRPRSDTPAIMSQAVAAMKSKQVLALTLVAIGGLTCLYVSPSCGPFF